MNYRPDIDGLRALAIVPVVLFHAGLGMSGGFVGVDVFFVISGFLLSKIVIQELDEKRFNILAFYERRFRRLAPAFVVMLLICFTVFSQIMLPADFITFAQSAQAATFFYANFHFHHTISYFSQSAELMPLLHMWSLAIEEQFYAVLPFSLMLALFVLPRTWLPFVIAAALLASFVMCIHYTNAYRPFAFYMPFTRAWELLAGTLLAALPRITCSPRTASQLGPAALGVLIFVLFWFDERDPFPGWIAAVPVTATATLIFCGAAAPQSLVPRLLSTRPLVFLGKISYSLYLWHWPVMVVPKYIDLAPERIETKLLCVALSLALATVSWAFVEQPVRRGVLLPRLSQIYAGTAATFGVILLLSMVIIKLDGLPNRVPPEIKTLLSTQDHTAEHQNCQFGTAAGSIAPCRHGPPSVAPSFILIGDSHAFSLSPGLFAATEELDRAGLRFTQNGFFPGSGLREIGMRSDTSETDRMLEIIAAHPDIRTIILVASWADYATGTNWKGQSWLYEDDIGSAASKLDNRDVFIRALDRMAEALPDHVIVVLDDVPTGHELDLNHLARRTMARPFDPTSAVLPATKVADRRASYVPLLEDLDTRYAHVYFVPALEDYCSGSSGCSLFQFGTKEPMYRDGDHLSQFGALSLTDRLMDHLEPILVDVPER